MNCSAVSKTCCRWAVTEPASGRKRSTREVSETEFGRVRVNFETHEASVGGEAVRMTPKELKLLKYFVENDDRVISRNELLSEVWELSGNLQTRAVDQFIARLRKIIEPDTAAPIHLLTIRDAGYRFVVEPKGSASRSSPSEGEGTAEP